LYYTQKQKDCYCKECRKQINKSYRSSKIYQTALAYWRKHHNSYTEFAYNFPELGDFTNPTIYIPEPRIGLIAFFAIHSSKQLPSYIKAFNYLFDPNPPISPTLIKKYLKIYRRYIPYFIFERTCNYCKQTLPTFIECATPQSFITLFNKKKRWNPITLLNFPKSKTSCCSYSNKCFTCFFAQTHSYHSSDPKNPEHPKHEIFLQHLEFMKNGN
jgi:hypothetical protein